MGEPLGDRVEILRARFAFLLGTALALQHLSHESGVGRDIQQLPSPTLYSQLRLPGCLK